MKIITLNTWAGIVGFPKLEEFFNKYKDTDIFCLQEVWKVDENTNKKHIIGMGSDKGHEYFKKLESWHPNHVSYFHPQYSDCFGLVSLVNKSINVLEEGELFVHLNKGDFIPKLEEIGTHARNIQYLLVEENNKEFYVINFHGLWNGEGKSDTPERLSQSDKIISFLKNLDKPYILTGDFNLLPDTKSLKMIEDLGLRNLIKENNITSTRTSLYTKPLQYADYTFVSDGIEVKDFKVLPDEVSDHVALYLEIE